jgi:hypothetical protein
MLHPSHSPWFDLPNNIWGWVQNMKLLIVQFSPFSCYFIPLRSKFSLITLFLNTLSLCSSLNVGNQVLHPYKTTCRIMVLYVLTFTFLNSRREDWRLWTEW